MNTEKSPVGNIVLATVRHRAATSPGSIIVAIKMANNAFLRYYANHQAHLYFEEINKDNAFYYPEHCLSLAKKE